jgi:quinol-cytochrome oxidoreductase complex cytochrome b subunit
MLSILHFLLLHEFGSNNPLGIIVRSDTIPFMPYYGIKDLFSLFICLFIFLIFIMLIPQFLGHSDNFILANSLVTPAHIIPE